MIQPRKKGLFAMALVCTLVYALMFSATTAFADESAPPETNTEETAELPADENQSEPATEVEEQAGAPDSETDLPAESQDEPDAEEALPADGEGTPPEQEFPSDEPVEAPAPLLDADSKPVDDPAMVTDEAETILTQLPTGTTIVVVVDNQIEPLATQAAANALVYGDPIWCPDGVTPGNDPLGDCTDSFGSFNTVGGVKGLLVADAAKKDLHDVTGKGTIYVESGAVADTDSIVINGNTFTGLQTYELTIQGGWDFGADQPSGAASMFSSPVRVVNWQNTVTIHDISIDLGNPATALNGLTVTTTGDINLNNVSSKNSSQHGASLNNSSGNGNIAVTASSFHGNGGNGLVANSKGAISLHNIAANTNGANGASLNDSNGTGAIALSGTNVFNGNAASGLRAVSTSDITSSDSLTADNNGGYGAFMNNSSGAGKVTFSGMARFNGNTLDGLRVVSTADIRIAADLTATNNSRHGVFLNNSSGAGNIAFTGMNTFSGNAFEGLRALSAGNITSTTGLTTENNRFGVYLDNTSGAGYVKLTGANTFNGNRRDGLYVKTNGDVTVKDTQASTNRQNGFNLETSKGKAYLWCGKGDNNGGYGVNLTQNQALYLFGMTFSGNTLGSVYVDGGSLYYGDCSGNLYGDTCANSNKGTDSQQKLAIKSVLVSSAQQQVTLDCRLYAGTKLVLPNGDSALIACPSGEFASLQGTPKADLPGELPEGWAYGSGFVLDLDQALGGGVSISFVIPEGMNAEALAILFWDGSEWVEVEGASLEGERFAAQVGHPGIFVLVGR